MPIRTRPVTEEQPAIRTRAITLRTRPVTIRTREIVKEDKKKKFDTSLNAWVDRALRPNYAIAGFARSFGAEKRSFKDVTRDALLPFLPIIRHRQAIKKGLTGETKDTFVDFLRDQMGEPENRFSHGVQTAVGLGLDIGLDPTTYMGSGVTRLIGKAIKKIPGVTKGAELAGKALLPVKKLFKKTTGIPKLDDLISKFSLEKEYLRGQSIKYGIKVRNIIQRTAKKVGRSVDDIMDEVVKLVEQPGQFIASSPETKTLANTLRTHFSNLLTREMKAGVNITALSKNKRGIEYFPRITTAEARQYLKQAKVNNSKVWDKNLASAINRKTGDFTLGEFNELVARHGLKSLGGETVEQFFMKNPSIAVATRGTGSAKAITSAKFMDEVGSVFGKAKNVAHASWDEVPEAIAKQYPKLQGKVFAPEVLEEMGKVYTKMKNPEEINMLLKGFDGIQNYWKAWTLSPFPEYHVRNFVGNMWNNYLANVVNPIVYSKAAALQRYRKTGKEFWLRRAGIVKAQADDIIKGAEKTGVLGQGWFGADIPQAVEEALEKGNWNLLSRKGKIIKYGRAAGTTIENNARLAHYVDKLGKGLSTDDAAKSVKKFLFDYADLSDFEKSTMKRLFPFYTWTRKNVPLQLEQLWKNPQKFLGVEKFRRSIAGGEQSELKYLAYANNWLEEKLPIRLGKPVKGVVKYMPLEGWLPLADLTKLSRAWEIPLEQLTPFLKVPLEQILNKNIYFESKIERRPGTGETREFLGQDVPVRVQHLLSQVRLLTLIHRFVPEKQEREAKPTFQEQLLRSLTAIKVYSFEIEELRDKAHFKLKQHVRELKSARKWADRTNRTAEVGRIDKALDDAYKELGEL